MNKSICIIGALLLLISIILGAFGAHALKEVISMERLTSFETGVRYQIYHGLALLIIGLNVDKFQFSLKWTSRLFILGVIFFSCSIYLLSIQDLLGINLRFLGPVTPIGGSLLIIGWGLFIYQLMIKSKN
ncbi:MAG: DUF423 domain-containing protein [Crocinitomicaceae bacterium]|nr:DUF423 domain-containing protein [Crocinitomicaceae bacterium]